MNAAQILESKRIRSNMPALFISASDAIESIQHYAESAEIQLDLNQLTRDELLTLIASFGDCVITYHPEGNHQQRATLLRNFEMLKKSGLQETDFETLDFA